LLQLVHAHFSRVVYTLEDVACHLVGQATLLTGAPELPTMDVGGIELPWLRDALPSHVGSGVPPTGVEAGAIGLGGGVGQVKTAPKLSPGDKTRPTRSLGIGL